MRHSRSMANAFIASPAETGRRSQQLPPTLVSPSSHARHWAGPSPAWLHPTIWWCSGLWYRDTIFAHETSPTKIVTTHSGTFLKCGLKQSDIIGFYVTMYPQSGTHGDSNTQRTSDHYNDDVAATYPLYQWEHPSQYLPTSENRE